MLNQEDKIFNNLYSQNGTDFKSAKACGDFVGLEDILSKSGLQIIEEIKASLLKGRGGAGFPTGLKWSFLNQKSGKPTYLVINGDEGEPGTCKDRELIRAEPYKIIEGVIVACYAMNIKTCYIYIRGEFYEEAEKLQDAINEIYKQGYLGQNCFSGKYSLDVYIHLGAGAYICGEESALLESLEGRKGFPRLKPPFPANVGLYGCPTIINNIETIAVIPTILKRGAKWFLDIGTANSAGTKLFCISGHVNNPCVVEEKLGISLKVLIEEYAGGVIGGWDNLFAVIPGGSSTPIIPARYCDNLKVDFDSMKEIGSAVGTGAIMVFNKSTDLLEIMHNIVSFYNHESCGQCTPCREGAASAVKLIEKVMNKTAKSEELDLLEKLMDKTFGTSICGLNDATVFAVKGFLRHYKEQIKLYMN